MGNGELLAVVLALQEWQHWLEGTWELFLIWSDQKNLEYLRSAQRLNSRQARWSLFLSRFNYSLSYCPRSKNRKPDALSRLFYCDTHLPDPEPIMPSPWIIGAATWEIETIVQAAQRTHPDAGTGPHNCLQVLKWGHSSKLICHP